MIRCVWVSVCICIAKDFGVVRWGFLGWGLLLIGAGRS
jgi:hypothetical protein